ncbi:hypothetical protein [Cellulomonas shaoxiangyii]|uniref:Uncharacterized protein n=1 Tax=Cellulomonas shaoxiangyii TaxID=2566013 RepID=A0A4P7SG07_9CELL|nr:hypothetical protein [Cellulomonas shaoxiangyii]QCB92447.1 hypothetical protein E5225_01630 [Cellulomonas shaoxiangyii]TGY85650.1 hypothetical protein E5226_05735 [Cellulomonas shaoxiangyii]
MELTLGLDEALVLARAAQALPTAVRDVRASGSTVHATVAVHELPGVPGAVKMATRLAGPVDVRIEDRGVTGRTWQVAVVAQHPTLRMDLSSFVTSAVRDQLAKLPAGVATARSEGGATLVDVDLDRLGPVVTSFLPAGRGVAPRVDDVALGERLRLVASVV